ncbi:MAG TPA: hypothetical protein VIV60_34140 [Polyangiaceae bacterium]
MLATDGRIVDSTLVVPLPIEALVSASSADDAVAKALLAKRNPVLENSLANSRAEGNASSILVVLQTRGLDVPDAVRRRILDCNDVEELTKLLKTAVTAQSADELLPFWT